MPDRNQFDDDSLIPSWMRDAGYGGSEEEPSAESEETAGNYPAGAPAAPWELLRGDPPPRPSRRSRAVSPWQQFAGDAAPPPAEQQVAAPWGFARRPAEPSGQGYEWSDALPPSAAGGQPPRSGLTSALGDLPWAEKQPAESDPNKVDPWRVELTEPIEPVDNPPSVIGQPDTGPQRKPSAAELAGLTDQQMTMSDLMSEFEQDVAPEAAPPTKKQSLADRLRAMSPKTGAPDPSRSAPPFAVPDTPPAAPRPAQPPAPPKPMNAEEADWMSAFGQSAGGKSNVPSGDEADLDWLMADESAQETGAQPSPEAEFDSLFEEEFTSASQSEAAGLEFGEEDLPWLGDEDQGAPVSRQEFNVSDDLSPDWLRSSFEESGPSVEPEIEEPPAVEAESLPDWLEPPAAPPPSAPPPGIRKLPSAAAPPPQPAEPPAGIRKLPSASAPPPAAPAQPPAGIRKLPSSAPPPAQPPAAIRKLPSAQLPAETPADQQSLTYEEWEQLQIEREREASKTDEDRLLEEVPDWFKEIPAEPPQAAASAQPEAPQGPDMMPGWFMGLEETSPEEAPDWLQKIDYSSDLLAQPFAAQEPSAPPSADEAEIPDWFKGSAAPEMEGIDFDAMFVAPSEPVAPPEPVQPPQQVAPPPEPEELAASDWLAAGEFQAEYPAAQPEYSPEEELPQPDMDLLGGLEEEEIQPGEVPPWLAAAAPGRGEIAAPEEVPFPELDLDQTMPGETAFGPHLEKEYEKVLNEEFPLPPDESDDFVERFEPMEPEPAPPDESVRPAARQALDQDAPDWLREVAAEQGLPTDLFPEQGEPSWDMQPPPEQELDWLSAISPEDVEPEKRYVDREVTDMPPRPEPGFIPASGLFDEAEPVDSAALDRLLGMYEPGTPSAAPQEQQETPPALEESWDEAWGDTAPAEADLFAEPGAMPAVPAAGPAASEPISDLESLFTEAGPGEALPDLASLFDESGFQDMGGDFTAEQPAAPVEDFQADEHRRPVPEAQPRFKTPPPAEPAAPPAEEPLPLSAEAHPEWVSEMRPSDLPVVIRAGGAETSVKQKQVVELPERLRAFREATLREMPKTEEAPEPVLSGPLAGISGALPMADVLLPQTTARPVEGLIITKEQQSRLNRLQILLDQVAAEEDQAQQERAGYDEAAQMALGEAAPEEEVALAGAAKRPRRKRRFKLDRVLVAVLLLAALILPFASDALYLGGNPPALKGDRRSVAGAVDTVAAGRYVLFAFEYGPTAAGELDPLAEAVLRDVLARRAIPLVISTNPAGAFHAEAVFKPLLNDPKLLAARAQSETSLTAGKDYYILSYLPGEIVGVRSLRDTSEDSAGNPLTLPAFKNDLRGHATHLNVTNLERDIALIVVVAEDSNAARMWAEQLNGVKVTKVELVTAAMEPLAIPYVNKDGYIGHLAGVRDAYSYNAARNTGSRTPYTLPKDLPVNLPDPEVSRWHSMASGAAAAAGVVALGVVVNLFRALTRRRRP